MKSFIYLYKLGKRNIINLILYFSEGKCLLELTHRGLGGNHEGRSATGTWVPIAKKVYWPPQATANTMNIKSENSGQSGKLFNLFTFSF